MCRYLQRQEITSHRQTRTVFLLSQATNADHQVNVIAAGGIYDGRGLAAMLMYGAQAVWVGTRFVAATEASAPKKHKEL